MVGETYPFERVSPRQVGLPATRLYLSYPRLARLTRLMCVLPLDIGESSPSRVTYLLAASESHPSNVVSINLPSDVTRVFLLVSPKTFLSAKPRGPRRSSS